MRVHKQKCLFIGLLDCWTLFSLHSHVRHCFCSEYTTGWWNLLINNTQAKLGLIAFSQSVLLSSQQQRNILIRPSRLRLRSCTTWGLCILAGDLTSYTKPSPSCSHAPFLPFSLGSYSATKQTGGQWLWRHTFTRSTSMFINLQTIPCFGMVQLQSLWSMMTGWMARWMHIKDRFCACPGGAIMYFNTQQRLRLSTEYTCPLGGMRGGAASLMSKHIIPEGLWPC